MAGGVGPDLRHMSAEKHQAWLGVVNGGAHARRGMVSFANIISADQATAIQANVIERSQQMIETQ